MIDFKPKQVLKYAELPLIGFCPRPTGGARSAPLNPKLHFNMPSTCVTTNAQIIFLNQPLNGNLT